MSDHASSNGYLATAARQGRGPLSSPCTCRDYHTHQSKPCSFRPKQRLAAYPRCHQYGRRRPTDPSEDLILLAHAPESSWTSPPGHLRLADTRQSFANDPTPAMMSRRVKTTPSSGSRGGQKSLEWTKLSQDDEVGQQPRTPQIRRLKTPELMPLHNSGQFCSCHSCSEFRYRKDRAKMDWQRECMAPLYLPPQRVVVTIRMR